MDKSEGTAPALLRVEDAARSLAIGRSKAYQLVADGRLPSVRIGGSVRISRRALEQWLEESTRGGTPTAA